MSRCSVRVHPCVVTCVSPLSNTSVGSRTKGGGEVLSSGRLGWSLGCWASSPGSSGVGGEEGVGISWIGWLRASARSTRAITSGGIGEKGGLKGSIIALSSPGLLGI